MEQNIYMRNQNGILHIQEIAGYFAVLAEVIPDKTMEEY